MRPVQYFTAEYLEQCKQMSHEQILQFLEDFRLLFAAQAAEEKWREADKHSLQKKQSPTNQPHTNNPLF